MIIIPAIDLRNGSCVRLYKGSFDEVTIYHNDPVIMAKSFESMGAQFLHVVDLDGAKEGQSQQVDLIIKIATQTHLQLQVGGGIRTKLQIETLLSHGVKRVVLGSIAIANPALVKQWLTQFGPEKIVLALDIRMNEHDQPLLATLGWQQMSSRSLWDVLDDYADLQHVLCTDISRDGTLQGVNRKLYQECQQRYPTLQFQASGGINSLQDLQQLSQIPVAAAIIGKALYENKFSLTEALAEVPPC